MALCLCLCSPPPVSDGMYTYKGSDLPEQTEDGRPGENQFVDNNILNTEVGVKIKEADNTVITGEQISRLTILPYFT